MVPAMHCVLLRFKIAQVAFWATLYLLRRAKWAVFGQPGPPKMHASQNIAKLCSCKTEDEARGLSLKQGYDAKGMAALRHLCAALERTGHALQLLTRGIRISVKQRLSISIIGRMTCPETQRYAVSRVKVHFLAACASAGLAWDVSQQVWVTVQGERPIL